jgi:16S rRNA (cytosine1402-N4)-methyltransferase
LTGTIDAGLQDENRLMGVHNPVHEPVMVGEVLVGLNCRSGRLYVDGTVGEGGHAAAILDRIGPEGELWGLDRDPHALQAAATRLAHHASKFHLFHHSYAQLGELLGAAGLPGAAGILLDLGLSSLQLQKSQRGFSFGGDEPLDMRFNPEEPGPTAATLLNRTPETELARIFREYGEEPRARRLARLVVQERRRRPFRTTGQLVKLVEQAQGPGWRRGRLHPATRVFQALRLAVNLELEELTAFLTHAPAWLEPGGRLVVIAYHSLEDRLVKQSMAAWERAGVMVRLTRKPLTPTVAEVQANPRARSAKLRIAEKMVH